MTSGPVIFRGAAPERSAAAIPLSRRGFLHAGAAAGGGLLLSLSLPFANGDAAAANAEGFTPNAFIRIGGNGRIVLTMPYVEMGQGTYTAIPMLIAEELEVELKQVRLEHAPPNEKLYANPLLGVQATGNSNAIRGAWQPLRQAGATARAMLVAAAPLCVQDYLRRFPELRIADAFDEARIRSASSASEWVERLRPAIGVPTTMSVWPV